MFWWPSFRTIRHFTLTAFPPMRFPFFSYLFIFFFFHSFSFTSFRSFFIIYFLIIFGECQTTPSVQKTKQQKQVVQYTQLQYESTFTRINCIFTMGNINDYGLIKAGNPSGTSQPILFIDKEVFFCFFLFWPAPSLCPKTSVNHLLELQ